MTSIGKLLIDKGTTIINKSEELPSPKKVSEKTTSYLAYSIDFIIRFFKNNTYPKVVLVLIILIVYYNLSFIKKLILH